MRITTRLYINALLTVATILLLSLVSTVAFRMEREARQRAAVANDLRAWAYELTVIGDRYLRHPGERAREQWLIRHADLVGTLHGLPAETAGERVVMRRMSRSLDDLLRIFRHLLAAEGANRPVAPELQNLLASLMLQESRQITLDASRLVSDSHRQMEKIERTVSFYLPLTAVLLVSLAVWFAFRIGRRIAAPIGKLRAGAEIFGSGRLDYRIGRLSDDELGQLAGAFDRMAEELLTTTVSRRELERRVAERTAELTAANKELEAFTYTVSHDLRAPLRHIASFVELLGADAGPGMSEQGRRYVGIIAGAARRLGAMVDDLLTFSRIGRGTLTRTAIDFRKLIDDVRRELEPDTADRDIAWVIGPLPPVQGDLNLLRTVFVNLLCNAIKYTRDRTPARIEVGAREKAGEVVCFVRDNGVGFDMRFVDKLFGVFQRLHPPQEFEGTGIGLASVRRAIERHGGRVWAEGEVGQGATFYFSLPATPPGRPEGPAEGASAHHPSRSEDEER